MSSDLNFSWWTTSVIEDTPTIYSCLFQIFLSDFLCLIVTCLVILVWCQRNKALATCHPNNTLDSKTTSVSSCFLFFFFLFFLQAEQLCQCLQDIIENLTLIYEFWDLECLRAVHKWGFMPGFPSRKLNLVYYQLVFFFRFINTERKKSGIALKLF